MPPRYVLPDEPAPGALERLAVRTLWPLLALMAAGSWLSWPWFAVNAHAVGSPHRWRDTLVAALGFVGSAVILAGILAAVEAHWIHGRTPVRLCLLGLLVWKVGVTYLLLALQAPAIQLFEYYRGQVHNGSWVVLAGFFVETRLMAVLPDFLRIAVR